MNKIFSFLLFIFVILNENSAQQNFQLSIHLGNFSQPAYADFSKIAHWGFLYAVKTDAAHADIFLTGFEDREKAEESLANLKKSGFPKAELAGRDLSKGKLQYYIQLGSMEKNKQVNWLKFGSVPALFAFPQSDAMKILSGPFSSLSEAKQALEMLQAKGFTDAFTREINSLATYPIGSFESGKILSDAPSPGRTFGMKGNAPESEVKTGAPATEDQLSFWPPKSMDAKTGSMPNILSNLKRNSVLSLQKLLKTENYYPGLLTGYYNDATKTAYEGALRNMPEMKPFISKTEIKPSGSVDMERLSSIIERLPEIKDPFSALNKFSDPLAKAYSAYLWFLKAGAGREVDSRMNSAIKGTFSGLSKTPANMPFFDFKAVYSYPNLEQVILHLFYLHSVPDHNLSTPCWLFNAHPKETQSATNRYHEAKVQNPYVRACDYVMDWQDVRLLHEILVYLGGKQPDQQELFQAAEERSFLYNKLQPLDAQASKSVLSWEIQTWEKMDLWGKKDPINSRLLTALKIAYAQSFVRIEDYFLNEGMAGIDAKNMTTAVLATLMSPYLERFMKS
jgi:hypothetical protein